MPEFLVLNDNDNGDLSIEKVEWKNPKIIKNLYWFGDSPEEARPIADVFPLEFQAEMQKVVDAYAAAKAAKNIAIKMRIELANKVRFK